MNLKQYRNLVLGLTIVLSLVFTLLFILYSTGINDSNMIKYDILIITVLIIGFVLLYLILDNKYNEHKEDLIKKGYIKSFEENGIPILITNASSQTSQHQTRNIITGAILYTLPETNSLKVSAINISGKSIKGFELQLKNVNVFNEVTSNKLIVVSQFINNDYKSVEIIQPINTVDFNTYLITRVIFMDGSIWYTK